MVEINPGSDLGKFVSSHGQTAGIVEILENTPVVHMYYGISGSSSLDAINTENNFIGGETANNWKVSAIDCDMRHVKFADASMNRTISATHYPKIVITGPKIVYGNACEITKVSFTFPSAKTIFDGISSMDFSYCRGTIQISENGIVTIAFSTGKSIFNCLNEVEKFMILLSTILQCYQDFHTVEIEIGGFVQDRGHRPFNVFCARDGLKGDISKSKRLIFPNRNPNEFQIVVANWMSGFEKFGFNKRRYWQNLRYLDKFPIQRLVESANLHEVGPIAPRRSGAVNALVDVLKSVAKERIAASEELKPLEDKLLNSLGRIKSHLSDENLNGKVKARWLKSAGDFAHKHNDMIKAIKYSVEARNYFVHGSTNSLAAHKIEENVEFFTTVFECIFGLSELHECGWRATKPFGNGIEGNCAELLRDLSKKITVLEE